MSYQVCRWYDPYPRLAFALKLLYLAPQPLQVKAAHSLESFFQENLGLRRILKSAAPLHALPDIGKRWYDNSEATSQAVELLKTCPESLKSQIADRLLQVLTE